MPDVGRASGRRRGFEEAFGVPNDRGVRSDSRVVPLLENGSVGVFGPVEEVDSDDEFL